ncbi:MAG: 5-oxoprolinase subunit PxpA [Saprospiraceae bacterium]
MKNKIDINCDLGEGMPNDARIMPFISSANIACGFHAGNVDLIKSTIDLCLQHEVHIGAHPSYHDRTNFGRTAIKLSDEELYDLMILQIQLLDTAAKKAGASLHHVKPHGALYNMAGRDRQMAFIISTAIHDYDASLILYGLANSLLSEEGIKAGLNVYQETFADRTYLDNGQLTSRSNNNALIEDEEEVAKQVLELLNGSITSVDVKEILVNADTICIHGDGPHAHSFAKIIYRTLEENGIQLMKTSIR